MAITNRGRQAVTRYTVLERFPVAGVALVRCKLETGRTHQIRVHLRAIGHPVVADPTYGDGRRPVAGVPRLFLHATRLAFDHPRTGERRLYESPLPPDLASALDALRSS
jgi:23S rRNA pseudouridine1911/1915/1917 synthase